MKNLRSIILFSLIFIIMLIALRFCEYKNGDRVLGNGIRPEVEARIERDFHLSKRQRLAVQQLARAFQMAIDKPENALEIFPIYLKAKACLKAIEELEQRDLPSSTLIEGLVVDTWLRSRAYAKYNGKLSGQVTEPIKPDLKACEFDTSQTGQ